MAIKRRSKGSKDGKGGQFAPNPAPAAAPVGAGVGLAAASALAPAGKAGHATDRPTQDKLEKSGWSAVECENERLADSWNRWDKQINSGGRLMLLELRNPGPDHWIISVTDAEEMGHMGWWRRSKTLSGVTGMAAEHLGLPVGALVVETDPAPGQTQTEIDAQIARINQADRDQAKTPVMSDALKYRRPDPWQPGEDETWEDVHDAWQHTPPGDRPG